MGDFCVKLGDCLVIFASHFGTLSGPLFGPFLDPFWGSFWAPFWIRFGINFGSRAGSIPGSVLDPSWDPWEIIAYGKPTRDEEPGRDDHLVNLLATKNLIAIKIKGTES